MISNQLIGAEEKDFWETPNKRIKHRRARI
jgi:hypothetical protein